jgi:hypothetical protein
MHQQFRLDRNRSCDPDPGALAAGKLMRKTRQKFQRQPALAGNCFDPRGECVAAQFAQLAQRIGNSVEGRETRIDTFAGVLKHHLNTRAVAIAGEDTRWLA